MNAPYYDDTVPLEDRPLAAHGLKSYRCASGGTTLLGGKKSWVMIGATDDEDAFKQALRSSFKCRREDLEVWDGEKYIPCTSKH